MNLRGPRPSRPCYDQAPRRRPPRPARWYDGTVPGKPISQQSRRGPGPLFGAICCSMFVLAGLGMAWFMYLHPAIQGHQALSSWARVPCTIVASKVGVHRDSHGSTYSIDISYRYQFNGGFYTSNRWGFFGGSSSGYSEKAAVVDRYRRGSQTTCYVDPANPSQAVLEPHSTAPMFFAFLPIGFITIGGFITTAFVVAAVRGRRPPPGERPGAADRPLVLRAGAARITRFIGIALFALALLNPRVAITLGRGAIPLGGTVDDVAPYDHLAGAAGPDRARTGRRRAHRPGPLVRPPPRQPARSPSRAV